MRHDTMIPDHPMTERAPILNGADAADERAIRDLFRQLLDAWGRGDGAAYGALTAHPAPPAASSTSATNESTRFLLLSARTITPPPRVSPGAPDRAAAWPPTRQSSR